MTDLINGIHHITALASDPQRNLDFYTRVLGLRMIKLTINFDDPGTYHFYFADKTGSPGTVLTFFPFPSARTGQVGAGQVGVISFAVPENSLDEWQRWLADLKISTQGIQERFGEPVLPFQDPDGLRRAPRQAAVVWHVAQAVPRRPLWASSWQLAQSFPAPAVKTR